MSLGTALAACEDQPTTTTNPSAGVPIGSSAPTTGAAASGTTAAAASGTGSAAAAPTGTAAVEAGDAVLLELLYLPDMKVPEDNRLTKEKIELGKMLFFDKRLGKDGNFACENCHYVDKGWADGLPFSTKANGKINGRHTPSLYNVGYQKHWYWEGRAPTLEAQVKAAWKGQMGAGDKMGERAAVVAKIPAYKQAFENAFDIKGEDVTEDHVVKAIASFVRSIRSGNAPYDKWEKDQKSGAMSEAAVRGWELFRGKAGCGACHAPPLFTDNRFHNVGIGYDKPEPDLGRFKVTKKDEDKGRFKTPSLRSVTTHPPYFHDGSAQTIEAAVDYMLSGGRKNDNLDSGMKKVALTKEQRADLLEFIKALEPAPEKFERPQLPESEVAPEAASSAAPAASAKAAAPSAKAAAPPAKAAAPPAKAAAPPK